MAKIFFTQFQNAELVVENGNPLGGSVVQTMVWMRAFHQLGHEIYLAQLGEDKRKLKKGFNWVNLVPIYNSMKFKKKLVWFSYRFPKMFFALKKIKPDYVYSSIPTWKVFFIGIICKILNIKHLIRVANDPDVDATLISNIPKLHIKLVHLAYKYSDLIVAQNNFQFQTLRHKYPQKKIIKLFNPIVVDSNWIKKKKQLEGYIAWVANFRHQKNLKLLFEICTTLPEEQILIAGIPKFPLDEETEFYLEKLKTLKNVNFIGLIPREEILHFFSMAKFLLNTSRYEGFSNTFLESMVTGTPILTTSLVNPDKIIDIFNLGYVYSSPKDLVDFLDNLNDSAYSILSGNCIEYIQTHHDHIQLGKKLLNYIENEL